MRTEPAYLTEARKHIGLREISGTLHNKTIQSWLRKLRAWWDDDETPWCGVFVAHCVGASGLPLPANWMRARSWLNWGVSCKPSVGAVVIFERQGGGHVGFIVGRDNTGRLLVLGGNQGNAVSIAPFAMNRVIGYRKHPSHNLNEVLPTFASQGASSVNEA